MAEMKTPYGLVVGLILTPPVPAQEQDAPAESTDKPKRTRKSKSE